MFSGRKRHMSSPILPINGPSELSRAAQSPDAGSAELSAFVSELAAGETAFALVAGRGSPPPELLEQIAAAGVIDERLRADGQQLRFSRAADGERTRVEIRDCDGNAVRTLSIAEAVEIAVGRPLG
jgi:hypothetical protein